MRRYPSQYMYDELALDHLKEYFEPDSRLVATAATAEGNRHAIPHISNGKWSNTPSVTISTQLTDCSLLPALYKLFSALIRPFEPLPSNFHEN